MRVYWTVCLPALALLHGAAGYTSDISLPRLPVFAIAGHAVGIAVLHRAGTDAGLVPLAIVLTGLPLYGALLAAAWLGRQAAEFRAAT